MAPAPADGATELSNDLVFGVFGIGWSVFPALEAPFFLHWRSRRRPWVAGLGSGAWGQLEAQSSRRNPSMRANSLTLWLTSVASSARAWQAIQRSLAPIGVPRRFQAVACTA